MTKILHLCLACFYIDGYSYQENLLPKFHKRLGFDVEIIASMESFDSSGKRCLLNDNSEPYINENGIAVRRLPYLFDGSVCRRIRRYKGLSSALSCSAPDILFIHGCQFSDMDIVVSFLKRHPGVKVFVDNHADELNSASGFLSKTLLHGMLWKRSAQLVLPYSQMFWGVLPARVDFLKAHYGIPSDRCSFLPMGGDDDEVVRATCEENVQKVRGILGVSPDEKLVVTGGKIDRNKYQILELMRAFCNADLANAKLLVFGPVATELKEAFDRLLEGGQIIYLPWANVQDSYDYFAAADLVVFPGKHSVYWEQAASVGAPLVVRRWPGIDHLECDGNLLYLSSEDAAEIEAALKKALDSSNYSKLRNAASVASVRFRYSDIAKKSICI